jgi:hypothetical protein
MKGLSQPSKKNIPSVQSAGTKEDIPLLTRKALPSVVLVVTFDKSGKEIRQGSGFVVSSDGKVVTNYHVIEGVSSALIKFASGAFYALDGVLAIDQKRDIALVKASGRDFPFLPLGDSESLQVGEAVIAIGSPLALEATVSNGIVSAIRELDESKTKTIQTTAAISPGSSGGVLLNSRGQVIGITAFQMTDGQNLNFAIPVNYIKPLLTTGTVIPFKPKEETTKVEGKSQIENSDTSPTMSRYIPKYWTEVRSGSLVTVRVEGDFLYEQGDFPGDGRYVQKTSRVCDTKRQGDRWVGKCSYRLLLTWASASSETWCPLALDEIITLVSPERIEGDSQGYDPPTKSQGTGLSCPRNDTQSFRLDSEVLSARLSLTRYPSAWASRIYLHCCVYSFSSTTVIAVPPRSSASERIASTSGCVLRNSARPRRNAPVPWP